MRAMRGGEFWTGEGHSKIQGAEEGKKAEDFFNIFRTATV